MTNELFIKPYLFYLIQFQHLSQRTNKITLVTFSEKNRETLGAEFSSFFELLGVRLFEVF